MAARKKIFIVDDEATIVEFVATILAHAGYDCLHAENGAEFLKRSKKERPDLVLLDVMLPDLDGISVCQRFRADAANRGIPVLMLTSLADGTTIEEAHLYGASGYIVKPFEESVLLARIEKALQGKKT